MSCVNIEHKTNIACPCVKRFRRLAAIIASLSTVLFVRKMKNMTAEQTHEFCKLAGHLFSMQYNIAVRCHGIFSVCVLLESVLYAVGDNC